MAWGLALWKLSLLLQCCTCLLCKGMEITQLYMDNSNVCAESADPHSDKIHWVSETKSLVLIGRSSSDHGSNGGFSCSVVIGGGTTKNSILRLHFEALHIADCGITLTVNQSLTSDFTSQTPMLFASCHHGSVTDLYSREKHFVRVNVRKRDINLYQYNFRINVTLTDSVPVTGLETHWLVIISLVIVVIVAFALWILAKYLMRRSKRWRERRREEMMERAIHLYNSQEQPPESDYMYTAIPHHDLPSSNGHGQAQHRSRPGRNRSGDIAFVHADGHIETFRMHDAQPARTHDANAPTQPDSTDPDRGVLFIQRGVGLVPRSPMGRMAGMGDEGDVSNGALESAQTVDYSGDLPPSYEEALNMPAPQDSQSPLYVNLDVGNRENKEEDDAKT